MAEWSPRIQELLASVDGHRRMHEMLEDVERDKKRNAMDARITLDRVPPEDRTGLVRYPVPLKGQRVAQLHLPPDLTRGDVTRLIGMLTALEVTPDDPIPHRPFDPPD